jgi:hypothetical protein
MKRFYYLFFICVFCFTVSAKSQKKGGVSIGKGGEAAYEKAILDIVSNNKGILIPRMSTSQRQELLSEIDLEAKGLMVYDYELSALNVWDGSKWRNLNNTVITDFILDDNNLTITDSDGSKYTVTINNVGDNAKIGVGVSLPLEGTEGDAFFTTGDHLFYVHDGVGWQKSSGYAQIALPEGQILIGNTLGAAISVNVHGDIVLSSDGTANIQENTITVDKIADGKSNQVLVTDNGGNPTWKNISDIHDGTGTDDQTLLEVLNSGNDAGEKSIVNLANPVNNKDAATKEYVDNKTIHAVAELYFGELNTFSGANETQVKGLTPTTNTNGDFSIVYTTSLGKYFSLAVPSSWRTPQLKVNNNETLMVFKPSQTLIINGIKYTLWQTNIVLPSGLNMTVN